MKVFISDELKDWDIAMGVGVVKGVNNRVDPNILNQLIESTVDQVRSSLSLDSLKDDPVIRLYRDFYWRLGIDPTKQRPSQEALIRRILRGEFPRINPVVDIGNIVSVKYKVPVGLYDLRKIGSVEYIVLRYAAEGEYFTPLGSPKMNLKGNQIVLASSDGKVIHVYPYRDSELTKIDEFTEDVLMVTAGVRGVDDGVLLDALSELGVLMERYLGGSFMAHGIVKVGRSLIINV